MDEELEIYRRVGDKDSSCHNFCEWQSYVYEKYGENKYSVATLKNFMHYLRREKNIAIESKEVWSGCIIPLLTVFIAIMYTLIFSVVSVINSYNNAIYNTANEEFMRYEGYDAEMIYRGLEQNLYSGMKFYTVGTIIVGLAVLMILSAASSKIRNNNLKSEFYSDYIEIIQDMVRAESGGKLDHDKEGD